VRTSRWNKTIYDPHVNILRVTTETMAAILGGADTITSAPFDECYKDPENPSRRLARNTQLVLKHEAFLGRVADPTGGSYYLEALTGQLARASWTLFQQIEEHGGYTRTQAGGFIARSLERSLAARESAVARRRRVFVGTNQFADPAESALDRIDEDRSFALRRGASAFEQLRLLTEWRVAEGLKRPRVLLAEFGDPRTRAARSNFALNFFACAGFEIISRRFRKPGDIAGESADLIVLCSSDPEYFGLAAQLMPNLKTPGAPVIVAGNPENADALQNIGIADFIHVRSNPLEFLEKWQKKLGLRS
jgi:methylmalonyl-CoA mutase